MLEDGSLVPGAGGGGARLHTKHLSTVKVAASEPVKEAAVIYA